MLRAVLELRQRHQIEVGGQFQLAGPCNFVVWSWVFWDGFVELDQTRRALRTWVTPQLGGGGPGRARSKTSMNKMARMAIEQVAAPGVPLKKRKQMALDISDKLWSDDLEGLRALRNKLHEIVDPDATGRWVGAPGARVDAVGELERLYLVHLGSEAVVTGDPPIPDSQFESARHICASHGPATPPNSLAFTRSPPIRTCSPSPRRDTRCLDHHLRCCSSWASSWPEFPLGRATRLEAPSGQLLARPRRISRDHLSHCVELGVRRFGQLELGGEVEIADASIHSVAPCGSDHGLLVLLR